MLLALALGQQFSAGYTIKCSSVAYGSGGIVGVWFRAVLEIAAGKLDALSRPFAIFKIPAVSAAYGRCQFTLTAPGQSKPAPLGILPGGCVVTFHAEGSSKKLMFNEALDKAVVELKKKRAVRAGNPPGPWSCRVTSIRYEEGGFTGGRGLIVTVE